MMMTGRIRLLPLVSVMMLGVALALSAARAGSDDHDAVREAVEHGQVRPLEEILGRVRGKLAGDIVGVKIDHKERWLYEIRVLNADGRLFEVQVDAQSGEIERIKEK
jgi:uncharacterized membrane protein YkoI